MSVRFQNLVSLLTDMENKGWVIDSFRFSYNNVNTVVVITRYTEEDNKPSGYAKIKVCFVLRKDIRVCLRGWADLWEVKFDSSQDFRSFWHIQNRENPRNLFVEFAEHFARFIPTEKIEEKTDDVERRILAGYAEGNDPRAIYCFDVRRNGSRDGVPNKRSRVNSDKARLLRPNLYQYFMTDQNLSFFFSINPEDEKTDVEIMSQFALR